MANQPPEAARPYLLRCATRSDSRAIRELIWKVRINPVALDWRRFLVAVDAQNRLLGCGQIKPHGDGSRELASIAVQPFAQGQGIGSALITRLLADAPRPIYLTCRHTLEDYYQPFGFRAIRDVQQLPPYFRRIRRLANFWVGITRGKSHLLVMIKST